MATAAANKTISVRTVVASLLSPILLRVTRLKSDGTACNDTLRVRASGALNDAQGSITTPSLTGYARVQSLCPTCPPMKLKFLKLGSLTSYRHSWAPRKKRWIWTVVDHKSPGILAFTVGDRSSKTFEQLWKRVQKWDCFWWVSDGYPVYPKFINAAEHIVSKTYMTRVESENTRLRHYLARLKRKTLCYSKSEEMLTLSVRLLIHYLRYRTVPLAKQIIP